MVALFFLLPRNWGFFFSSLLIWGSINIAHANENLIKPVLIEKGVYALVGEIGGRTYENHGLNANFGVIKTNEGVILIDSGASAQGAAVLEKIIQKLTNKKVKWVINTGSQDHRWLGNDHFSKQGAEIIALKQTTLTQQISAVAQIDSLKNSLKEHFDGTKPFTSPKALDTNLAKLTVGGTQLEIRYLNHAHFAGDVVVYLPQQNILFSGDHIYVDRLLGVLPQSNATTWLDAFTKIETINPKIIVPGHGSVCDLAKAKKQTGSYLKFLVDGTKKYAEDMAGVENAVKGLSNAPQFEKLANFNELHKGNISRTYLRLESQ